MLKSGADKLEFQKCRRFARNCRFQRNWRFARNWRFQRNYRFGVSYMGSKNQIVKALIPQLPKAKYFIDLFAGGCAMTHGAMLSGKYERFIANDISDAPSLFKRAINGEFYDYAEHLARRGYKVFISEYEMPNDRFKSVFFVEKRQALNGKGARAIKQEHLFVPLVAEKKQVICA